MDHFPIIQALCRAALAQPTPAVRKQVERLRDALTKDGETKVAGALSSLLTAADRSVELVPSRIAKSRAQFPGETLSRNTQVPVDRETAAPLADIVFPPDVSPQPPLFDDTVSRAIGSLLEEWGSLEALAEVGVEAPKTCLIYGAPGTGKTRLALWLSAQLELPVLVAKIDGLISSFLGTTARNIGNLFAFANRYRCVLLLDEFDAIAKLRDDPQEVGEIKRVVNALLQNLDSRREIGLTIGITNHPRLLDPAVWRRFEVQLEIPWPNFDVRVEIARSFMPPVTAPEAHLRLIAWFTEGATGAEIEALVRTYKKARAVRVGEPRQLLDTLRQFATLNSARIDPKRRELLFADIGVLFKAMSRDPSLGFSYEDIGNIAGKDKSTISRHISKSGEVELGTGDQ
ncbi:AAA family ATPase [Rhodoblastus sp.]|uniref:AAA family ATPase n=1 Tax=Rhodoblastus sp. TaxID=1962975 RepID=UPI003F9C1422